METRTYQTAKEFFKFLNNYEADIWIRGSRAYNVSGELIAEYNTKKTMKKVSFDFDSTLSKPSVQQYAKGLIQRGFEVWIVTSRFGFGKEPNPQWNDDVFEVAREVGIKKEHIFFTCMTNKSEFLKDKDFLFHIDDDNIELSFIKSDTNVIPIYLWHNKNWIRDCEIAINKI